MDDEQLFKLIGELVFEFGFLESKLGTVSHVLCGSIDQWPIFESLLPTTAATGQKLDAIERLVNLVCSEDDKKEWFLLIQEIRGLSTSRNRIVHGAIIREDGVYKVLYGKKTKDIKESMKEFDLDLGYLKELLDRLRSRQRQISDFIQDYRIRKGEAPEVPLSQEVHGRLRI
ncbi:hypothetical protein LG325_08640 [Marinobacter nauticus]